jgi:hypothetical protein
MAFFLFRSRYTGIVFCGELRCLLKFTRLVLAQSGLIFEETRFANLCDLGRPTIGKYMRVVEQTL